MKNHRNGSTSGTLASSLNPAYITRPDRGRKSGPPRRKNLNFYDGLDTSERRTGRTIGARIAAGFDLLHCGEQ